ncbi:MAG: hypothetical protein LBL66_06845 [Clostridiales bacterium]|jgi:hypothetical protein|nr:hypothetical protein [Clostridiales bacterium]
MHTDINELLIGGSERYYDYLEETGKGLILFDVAGAERVFEDVGKKCLYRLRLDKKIKNTDQMMIRARNKIYLPNHVKIILWDEDKKDLVVQVVNKKAQEELAGLENFDPKEIKVVLDLKHLVSRTGKWFESHNVVLPSRPAPLPPVTAFDGTSDGQRKAVEFCLNRGFSYVWGAPGSGKSKYVLTNAALNLFRAGKRIVIAAPTNNAVEQALKCVIERFDAEGVDRGNIIRLGMPSKAFADRFPEVVEIRGVSQIIAALTKQKELLEDILRFKTERETMGEVVAALQDRIGKNNALSGAARDMLKNMEREFAEKERLYAAYEGDGAEGIRDKIEELNEQLADGEGQSTGERIRTLSVIGCTVDYYIGGFSQGGGGRPPAFDRIFLDEAGYCSLAKAAALFSDGTPVTFLGDHFQLPPVCEMDGGLIAGEENREAFVWAQSALYLADLIGNGAETEYARYMKKIPPSFRDMPKVDLTETYRFGQNLLDILCRNVYGTTLRSGNQDGITIEVVHAPRRTLTDKKRANPDEADAAREYLRKNFLQLGDAAVLTPYKNQASLLRRGCYRFVGDNILTVHGSQGGEWDTVVLSVCDTADKYFTDSNNPRSGGRLILNTAVSRVKKKLVIVCDETYWAKQSGQLLCELVRNKTGGAARSAQSTVKG